MKWLGLAFVCLTLSNLTGCASAREEAWDARVQTARDIEDYLSGTWRVDLPASPPAWIHQDLLPRDPKTGQDLDPEAIWVAFVPPYRDGSIQSDELQGVLVVHTKTRDETYTRVTHYEVASDGAAAHLRLGGSMRMFMSRADTSRALVLLDFQDVELELHPCASTDVPPLLMDGNQQPRTAPDVLQPH